MADSTTSKVTETVTEAATKVGTVKIPLDEYNELLRKAARPVVQNVTRVVKTNAQAAAENKAIGIGLIACGILGGGALAIFGAVLYQSAEDIGKS